MTNLNTNLTLETIQKSKALQEINPEKWSFHLSHKELFGDDSYYLTIADVISNAESLFRHPMITNQEILIKCYQNKPLADIEKYVLSNLK